jgi:hypothetical protein
MMLVVTICGTVSFAFAGKSIADGAEALEAAVTSGAPIEIEGGQIVVGRRARLAGVTAYMDSETALSIHEKADEATP